LLSTKNWHLGVPPDFFIDCCAEFYKTNCP